VKEIDAGAYIAVSVAVAENRAYFGHYENEFLCIDLAAGNVAWRFKDRPFPFFSSPAVIGDRILVGGRDKRLHCLQKKDGKEIWSFAARGKVDSSPVVCGDKVVVGSDDGRLYLVNLTNGKEVWNYEIGRPISASPAIVNGQIVVGSEDGSIYAFGAKGPASK
jgi:eukaryotic-like serine/threonine-protein kinase